MSLFESLVGCVRPTADPYIVLTANFPQGKVGVAYVGFVRGTNAGGATGAFTYSVDTLPAGLSLNTATGAVTGTPTTNQTVVSTFTVTNGTQTRNPAYTLAMAPATIGSTAMVTGTLSDGTNINVAVPKGERMAMVAGNIQRGSVMFHADGLSVCLENAYMGVVGDLVGTFTVSVDGIQLFSGALTIFPYTRTRPFWVTAPQLVSSPDLSPFDNYGPGSSGSSYAALYATADNSPMGRGLAHPYLEDQGERPDLGPIPAWDCAYICNPTLANAQVVRGMSDAAAVWQYKCIDPSTNDLVDMRGNPNITFNPALQGVSGNPIVKVTTKNPKTVQEAQAHAPSFCALACALYGTEYDKEELAFWANYTSSLWQSWWYRQSNGCVTTQHVQTRGTGRGLTILLYATKLSGRFDYFAPWVTSILTWGNNFWLSGRPGVAVDPMDVAYHIPDSGPTANGYAPWMMHILIQGLGTAIRYGYTMAQAPFDYFVATLLDSMLVTQHEFATYYAVCAVTSDGTNVADWAQGMAEVAKLKPNVASALTYAENSPELSSALNLGNSAYKAGDFTGYPWSPEGYASMLQPALAYAARYASDQVRAQAAWAKHVQWIRADYSQEAKYNIYPPT